MNSETPEKKYTLLFTLPKSTILIGALYTIILLSIMFLSLKFRILSWSVVLAFLGLNILQIYILKYVGSSLVPYSTLRRIMSAEIIASLILLLFFPAYLLLLKRLFLYVAVTLTIIFRFVIYYGAFVEREAEALSIALLPVLPFIFLVKEPINTIPFILLIPLSLFLFSRLDRIGKQEIGEKTTNLFKYFMSAWVSDYPLLLEKFLEKNSMNFKTKAYSLIFQDNNDLIRIIVPYIHPGPFKPIGSYNLPYELKRNFANENVIVLHGPVDHKLNLPSHGELLNLLRALKNEKNKIKIKMDGMSTIKSKNFELIALQFEKNYIILIINPLTPCEDFSLEFFENEKEYNLIIVDAHNNLGKKPDNRKIKEINSLIKELSFSLENYKDEIPIGYAHEEPWEAGDIGPGGVDCLTFMPKKNLYYSLIVFDANNAKPQLAEKLRFDLEKKDHKILILTTDSHFNAAKIIDEKGYKALGEETNYQDLLNICKKLIKKSTRDIKLMKISLVEHDIEIKVIGEETLSRINITLNNSLKKFKEFWTFLFATLVTIITFFILVNI